MEVVDISLEAVEEFLIMGVEVDNGAEVEEQAEIIEEGVEMVVLMGAVVQFAAGQIITEVVGMVVLMVEEDAEIQNLVKVDNLEVMEEIVLINQILMQKTVQIRMAGPMYFMTEIHIFMVLVDVVLEEI